MLAWPADAHRLDALRAAAVPRLLLVAPGQAPPSLGDDLEDWVRQPADHEEIELRCRRLARFARELLDGRMSPDEGDEARAVGPARSTPTDLRVS
jgi:hypothetical protein